MSNRYLAFAEIYFWLSGNITGKRAEFLSTELVKYACFGETKIFTISSVCFLRENLSGRGKIGLCTSM